MKGFHFRILTPEQQHAAIEIRANALYQKDISRAEREDWFLACDELRRAGNQNPTKDQTRFIAYTKYEKRKALETETERKAATLSNWYRAEQQLLGGDSCFSDFGLPTVLFGEFNFNELTPEQRHLAIERDANRHFRWRILHEEEEDWFKATKQAEPANGKAPSWGEVKVAAETFYAERSTEARRAEAANRDWLESESYLKERNTAYLPVALVPQLKSKRTFNSYDK